MSTGSSRPRGFLERILGWGSRDEAADDDAGHVVRGGAAADLQKARAEPTNVLKQARRWPRISLDLEARLQFDNTAAVSAHILNVSERGFFLAMDRPKPIGTQVHIHVAVTDPPLDTRVSGTIVHVVAETSPGAELPAGVGVFLTAADGAWTDFCRTLGARKTQD